jgi:hypothetical protein
MPSEGRATGIASGRGLILVLAFWVAIPAGCATIWQPVDGHLQTACCIIEIPRDWMRLTTPTYDMFSRDGPYLQYILLQERPVATPFRYTRQKMEAAMLPHEMARVVIDNLSMDPHIRDLRLLENGPAMVGGQPGFKLIFTYQDTQGVDMQTLYYGAVHADRYVNLRYNATQRHYFDVDRNRFDQVFQSLRFVSER